MINMKTSPNCTLVVQYFETCALKAYPDPKSPLAQAIRAGLGTSGLSGAPWTAMWGATGPDITPGSVWTQDQADARLAKDIVYRESDANQAIKVPMTQGQFDAFVSILFNVGHGSPIHDGIIRLKTTYPSTLLRKLNDGDYAGARAEFARWISPGTSVELGLKRRRRAEQALWDGLSGHEAIALGAAVTA